jgi:hypothetical protein
MAKMPQFSLKQFLVSISLIAIGLAIIALVVNWRLPADQWSFRLHMWVRVVSWRGAANDGFRILLWFIGGAMIGARLFVPFKRPKRGVIIGLAFQGAMLVILRAIYFLL